MLRARQSTYVVIASGLTVHKFTEAGGGGQYRVTAVAPTGSSSHPVSHGPDNCFPFDPSVERGERRLASTGARRCQWVR